MRTTFPRSSAAVSGFELSHSLAPPSEANSVRAEGEVGGEACGEAVEDAMVSTAASRRCLAFNFRSARGPRDHRPQGRFWQPADQVSCGGPPCVRLGDSGHESALNRGDTDEERDEGAVTGRAGVV